MREVLGMMELVYILILMVVIQIHMCAKTCVTIHPPQEKWSFVLCKSFFNGNSILSKRHKGRKPERLVCDTELEVAA